MTYADYDWSGEESEGTDSLCATPAGTYHSSQRGPGTWQRGMRLKQHHNIMF